MSGDEDMGDGTLAAGTDGVDALHEDGNAQDHQADGARADKDVVSISEAGSRDGRMRQCSYVPEQSIDSSNITQADMRRFLEEYETALDGNASDRLDGLITIFKGLLPKYRTDSKQYDADECLKVVLHLISGAQTAGTSAAPGVDVLAVTNPGEAWAKFQASHQSPVHHQLYGLHNVGRVVL